MRRLRAGWSEAGAAVSASGGFASRGHQPSGGVAAGFAQRREQGRLRHGRGPRNDAREVARKNKSSSRCPKGGE